MFSAASNQGPRKLLITGASGLLGPALCQEAQDAGFEVIAVSNRHSISDEFSNYRVRQDLCDRDILAALFQQFKPQAVIHAAAMSNPEACEEQPLLSRRLNVELTRDMGKLCRDYDAALAFTSTDLVFDGCQGNYCESDPVNPINRYGEHKAEAEESLRELYPQTLIVRLPLLFGFSQSRPSPMAQWLEALREEKEVFGFQDEYRSPVDYRTAARGLVTLLSQESGCTLHLGGIETLSRLELMRQSADAFGLDPDRIQARKQQSGSFLARRPSDTSLDSRKARSLGYKTPFLSDSLRVLCRETP